MLKQKYDGGRPPVQESDLGPRPQGDDAQKPARAEPQADGQIGWRSKIASAADMPAATPQGRRPVETEPCASCGLFLYTPRPALSWHPAESRLIPMMFAASEAPAFFSGDPRSGPGYDRPRPGRCLAPGDRASPTWPQAAAADGVAVFMLPPRQAVRPSLRARRCRGGS